MGNVFSKKKNRERPPKGSGPSTYPERPYQGGGAGQQQPLYRQQPYQPGTNRNNMPNHAETMGQSEVNAGHQVPPDYPTPMSAPTPSTVVRVRALYKYCAQNRDDLDFNKGDVMIVESGLSESWWLARHLRTGQQGYIPSNYVVVEDGRPTSLDAWFDISRNEADRLLLVPGLLLGTYILRPSSRKSYALT
ncbi:unnamed protein product [Dibothriocephalus latus]|uniref:SH3 domain-containing protein n=1 Tax=Dibothriocephalus latus TaxID=60516 RepID=A0A3P7MTC3_DIBLA|nr:unnamed protein product [Dibothriocephalus latus]